MKTRLVVSRAALAAALLALAACGRSQNQSADSAAPADTNRLGPPVGSAKPTMDSGFNAGQQRLDSLKQAGETPATGIAKGIQPAAHASANDSSQGAHSLKAKPTNVP